MGLLTLSGTDTIENYADVLKSVTFRIGPDVTNINTAVVRDISVRVGDGDLMSNDTSSKVTVINAHPGHGDAAARACPPGEPGRLLHRHRKHRQRRPAKYRGHLRGGARLQPHVPLAGRRQNIAKYYCIVSDVQGRVDNLVTVTAIEPQTSTQVSDNDQASARMLQPIIVDISPAPAVATCW